MFPKAQDGDHLSCLFLLGTTPFRPRALPHLECSGLKNAGPMCVSELQAVWRRVIIPSEEEEAEARIGGPLGEPKTTALSMPPTPTYSPGLQEIQS